MNPFYYIPKAILANIPETVHDQGIILPIVSAYRELKRGKKIGLFTYKMGANGVEKISAENYKANLQKFYEKCELINLCSSKLVTLDLVPRRPKEIAKELHITLTYRNLSHDDIVQTVKAVTGYTNAVPFKDYEKAINSLRYIMTNPPK